jgi:hypothetical protein
LLLSYYCYEVDHSAKTGEAVSPGKKEGKNTKNIFEK